MTTLDIAEPQVLIYFPDDMIGWHHRVLLRRLRESTWIVATPDGDIEVTNLADHPISAVGRGARLPTEIAMDSYLFEGASEDQLAEWHAAAARMATVLGAPPVSTADSLSPPAAWRIADTSAGDFGEEVPDDVVSNPATGVSRGAVGLALCGLPRRWVFVERVPVAEVAAWEADKHEGAGRDRRIGAAAAAGTTRSTIPLQVAFDAFRPMDLAKRDDWPHAGPRALVEVIRSILVLGLTFFTYHDHWQKNAGIHPDSSFAWEHKVLCTMLGLFVNYDRLDGSNCASGEFAARRLVMLERAVKIDPRCPNFAGLHKMIEHSLEEGGGVATKEFTAHMAQLAEADARILKQNRLYREELATKGKASSSSGPGHGGGGGDGGGGAGGGGGGGGGGRRRKGQEHP